ncbi:MAG: 4Fe-4S dicluster-binding protein [candidate division WOR-3 bacterium]
MSRLKGWQELPCGAIIEDLQAVLENKTGTWRSQRPVWDEKKCRPCYLCWVYCPDSAIIIKDGKVAGIDYDYCKGCGICSTVCPRSAITMEKEKK